MNTARLILVRFGALFAYLGAHWSGGRAIDAWKSAFATESTAAVGLIELVGSTCAALISAGACLWFLFAAWRGYRAHREGADAHTRRTAGDVLLRRAHTDGDSPSGALASSGTGSFADRKEPR